MHIIIEIAAVLIWFGLIGYCGLTRPKEVKQSTALMEFCECQCPEKVWCQYPGPVFCPQTRAMIEYVAARERTAASRLFQVLNQ